MFSRFLDKIKEDFTIEAVAQYDEGAFDTDSGLHNKVYLRTSIAEYALRDTLCWLQIVIYEFRPRVL